MSTNRQDITAGIGCFTFIFGLLAWFFFSVILASFPAKEDLDCHYAQGCSQVLVACMMALRTDNVLLKQWKGGSLSIYVDQQKFEDIPFPDRDRMLKPIVEDWCEYHSGLLLPSVWFVDMRTGHTLNNYGCLGIALSRMWEKASQAKAPQQRQTPVPKNETPEQIEERIRKQMGLPAKTAPAAQTAPSIEQKIQQMTPEQRLQRIHELEQKKQRAGQP